VIESWKAVVRALASSDRAVAATEGKGAAIVPVMVTRLVEPRLLGRDRQREVLERLLEGARAGHGGVLVLHGDPGVGKTALLEFAVENGRDFRVVRTAGVEGEM
jgi:MoxR-like ATPase